MAMTLGDSPMYTIIELPTRELNRTLLANSRIQSLPHLTKATKIAQDCNYALTGEDSKHFFKSLMSQYSDGR